MSAREPIAAVARQLKVQGLLLIAQLQPAMHGIAAEVKNLTPNHKFPEPPSHAAISQLDKS